MITDGSLEIAQYRVAVYDIGFSALPLSEGPID